MNDEKDVTLSLTCIRSVCKQTNTRHTMFYKLIEKKRDEWLAAPTCPVRDLLLYIKEKGMMRDAQTDAIKTYLYLKIECGNRPLYRLFTEGTFNSIDLDSIELSAEARRTLYENKAAAALFEYSRLTDRNGQQLAPTLERYIKAHAAEIDYKEVFRRIFYGVSYTDYLFSLPMGAGKTYLMAAFIYLDLYFAVNEPDNPVFAHNFIILAPSGLKSSIVPSLKHIGEFDPSWIIPEPYAMNLKQMLKFEILDEQKTAKKSNLIKNPNARKLVSYQPFDCLMGLVAVTNAEKVILDRIDAATDQRMYDEEEWNRIVTANELRSIIGKLPNLAIYIDEVHHASDGEIKLRQVVEGWTKSNTFNSVLGFSGTPYLETAEKVNIGEGLDIKNTDLANVVYNYPLIDGLGNFLKTPEVKYADNDTKFIVCSGVKDFLDRYKDTVYANGTKAKLAIYCGQIEPLEEVIYPLIAEIVSNYGLQPATAILKYHGGNKTYPQPTGAAAAFSSLDTELSDVRIVLLVQIGKEGWDCKSLTGVVLPQKGVCPTNMVLQTSCRCLRQVVRHEKETALIWLNKFNADTLNRQLEQQQNISLQEFGNAEDKGKVKIERFSRMDKLNLPPVNFMQMKVSCIIRNDTEQPDTAALLHSDDLLERSKQTIVYAQDMEGNKLDANLAENTSCSDVAYFYFWMLQIAKESFFTLPISELKQYENELRNIFNKITIRKDGILYFNNEYDQEMIRSHIGMAFCTRHHLEYEEERVPQEARLLKVESLTSPVYAEDESLYYPKQADMKDIKEWDNVKAAPTLTAEMQALIDKIKAMGMTVKGDKDPHPERSKTYHYIPYHFDSQFEEKFFTQSLMRIIRDRQLEVYFNGDNALTDFKIDCYKRKGRGWRYVGKYTPDFLLLSRKSGKIDRMLIIETKGGIYEDSFKERRRFMEEEFLKLNNGVEGQPKFSFLYIKDTDKEDEREAKLITAVNDFFNN